jgi:spermidine synthase
VNADAIVWLAEDSTSNERAFDVAVVDFPDPNNFALGKLFRFFRMICGRAVTEGLQVACHDVRASGWS